MKCLVTGGGGFIGSAIVAKLVKEGHQVSVLGRFEQPHFISSSILKKVVIVKGDVRNSETVDAAAQDCEQIFHFAGIVNSDAASGLSDDVVTTEITGLRNICESAVKLGVEKVIYGSSCAVYGEDELSEALSEESPAHPKSHYADLKRKGELLLDSYGEDHSFAHVILRIFNPYGVNQPKNMAMHRFFDAAIENNPLQIYGAGDQTRDFIYIDDVATAAVLAAKKMSTSGILNVCTGKDRSIRDIAETIVGMVKSASDINYLPIPSGRVGAELSRSYGSISKLQALTGFAPMIELEEGLKLMYEDLVSEPSTA